MPQFTIYQSEHGVRNENEQLKRELAAMKRDNNRLRALVGETLIPVAAEAELTPVELSAQRAAALSGSGESFKTGNCTVTISKPDQGPAAAPALNPMVARARAGKKAPIKAPAVIDIPQEADPVQQTQQLNGVDTDDAALRFSLIER